MKKLALLLVSMLTLFSATAQKKNFTYKFYGFVRGDLFYNTRANMAPVDGNFYLFPLDEKPDADGKDLNATPNGSFYTFTSRLGLSVTGPNVGSARTSACLETDFGGFSGSTTMLRIRQAWVALDWDKSNVLIGHTWHPLFGSVFPDMLNLSTGAPFQPFNRSPQIRYQYKAGNVKLTASAIWQLQYTSSGPKGMSEDYIKNSCVPEFYAGVDYKTNNWLVGIGADLISLAPRVKSEVGDKIYKVKERVTSVSVEAHARYTDDNWKISAKTIMGENLAHLCMLGGYGVSSIDKRTGEQEYTSYRHSMTWLNVVYGKKWQPGLFVGYLKNLGAGKDIVGPTYGVGLDVDQVFTTNLQLSYVLPHWKLGVEYSPSLAWYGDRTLADGRIRDTHSVTNHRVLGVLIYSF